MSRQFAYATLLTKSKYLPGVLVLNHGLREVKSKYPLVVVAPATLPEEARNALKALNIPVREIDYLNPKEASTEELDERFADTWTKLRVFELFEYKRVVLLDCDMVVKKNMDDLFDALELLPGHIAAAHVCACNPRKIPSYPKDWIPENCAHTAVKSPTSPPPDVTPSSPRPYHLLNSGLVVLQPSKDTFQIILDHLFYAPAVPTYRFPDQDLLAAVFKGKWKTLPWYYNALRPLRNIHPAMWSDDEVRCVHYILADKPWQSRLMIHDKAFARVNQWWWDSYDAAHKILKESDPAIADFIETYVDYDKEWRP
ncbi:glycosyl transferase [Coprinopsis cinerea okayama7|uniref:Glycosyl transferase n=1 Tax=Coprinopsis cinerea (strain Okayama-7 / 130 / ATCC MYA-4618 / FGSC 9003) TaxID=240176 RepID=D6RJT1_COPC7|nr:glycosyl transferase [Coprinopsis cinerea okayama7\|eukprot:XP_002912132.1 glycosyl transferase [Coprinopsis cinerea okayama7\